MKETNLDYEFGFLITVVMLLPFILAIQFACFVDDITKRLQWWRATK